MKNLFLSWRKPESTPTITPAPAPTHFSAQHLAALTYAFLGFRVLPIWPNSKRPMTINGHKNATTNSALINTWWRRTPNANVAIVTDNLLAIDVDVKNGKDGKKLLKDLESKHGPLPLTRMQLTPSGGIHYIYRTNTIVPSLIDCPGPGIDIRAHDGYILVAPSAVDGKAYAMSTTDIAEAPEWLVKLIMDFVTDNNLDQIAVAYHDSESSVTNLNLTNTDDVVCITGMGQTLKVKYDPVSMKLVTL